MLSNTLFNFEDKEMFPYVSFIVSYGGYICELFMDVQAIAKKSERENQYKMKVDFIQCYEKVFSFLDEENSAKVANLDFPLEEVLTTILAEMDPLTTTGCLKMLGEIITNSEAMTTKIVSTKPQLKLLQSLQLVLINYDSQTKGTALWLLGNICVNSLGDAEAVVQSGIISHVCLACSSETVKGVRQEALYVLASLVIFFEQHDPQTLKLFLG